MEAVARQRPCLIHTLSLAIGIGCTFPACVLLGWELAVFAQEEDKEIRTGAFADELAVDDESSDDERGPRGRNNKPVRGWT